jgi:hypothetical protein
VGAHTGGEEVGRKDKRLADMARAGDKHLVEGGVGRHCEGGTDKCWDDANPKHSVSQIFRSHIQRRDSRMAVGDTVHSKAAASAGMVLHFLDLVDIDIDARGRWVDMDSSHPVADRREAPLAYSRPLDVDHRAEDMHSFRRENAHPLVGLAGSILLDLGRPAEGTDCAGDPVPPS